ncbi:MAG: type II toxin-antitoxin system Phd/YefM family antitoxin [Chitinispirillales bacterium]|jgi:prevent-host-death family protein|nr:type II toxin-antitoxin system Phd/YefM family antitoxin [Chitinispirillales bacterium]
MQKWQLQEAKTKFSELVKQTQLAPQTITVHGEPIAVIVSIQKYRNLVEPKQGIHEFLSASPLSDVQLRFSRNPSTTLRDINL